MTEKTFIRITNKDIYEKLEDIGEKVSKINGTVKWHTLAISVTFTAFFVLISMFAAMR